MKCPKCKIEYLKPTKLEAGLSAMGCSVCGGAYVSLLYYRDWLEREDPELTGNVSQNLIEIKDTVTALSCPKCKKIMQKFQITGDSSTRMDLCKYCDEVWLDKGEWELLKQLELADKMPQVFSSEWQKKVKIDQFEKAREVKLLKFVNGEDFKKAKEIRSWIKNHPYKFEIIQFISQITDS